MNICDLITLHSSAKVVVTIQLYWVKNKASLLDTIREINAFNDNKTVLYVCGDAKNMSRQVNDTIVECTSKSLG